MKKLIFFIPALFLIIINGVISEPLRAQNRAYIANDCHTDYFWRASGSSIDSAMIEMIDYYLDAADNSIDEKPEYQSRFNCDGSYWLWVYENNKSPQEFMRLIEYIKSGHISVPLNPLVLLTGGASAEAIIRGMYYAGSIERKYGLDIDLASAIENQTQPLGLASLYSGAGAKYSWKGICACATKMPEIRSKRVHEMYWWKGLDDQRVLMKWYNFTGDDNQSLGGYAEARRTDEVVSILGEKLNTKEYPYSVGGAFGKGWDDVLSLTTEFMDVAKKRSSDSLQVIVSSEEDFFSEFESRYGDNLPELSVSYGNDWDVWMASAQELVSQVKRSVEKLRNAEALAALVSIHNHGFMNSRKRERDECFMNMGLFYEHNWLGNSRWFPGEVRIKWSKSLAANISLYINSLFADAVKELSEQIKKTGENQYYVFNSLSWERTDYADLEFKGPFPVHVIDISNGTQVPSQVIVKESKKYVRILARDIPSVGFKVYEIRKGKGTDPNNSAVNIDKNRGILENEFYKLHVNSMGAISSIQDKKRGNEEFVGSANGITTNYLIRDSLEWMKRLAKKKISQIEPNSSPGTIQIEDSGMVSATLKISSTNPIRHITRVTLYREIDRIEIENEITDNFNDELKWQFSFNIENPEIHHEELGAILTAKPVTEGGHYAVSQSNVEWLTANHFIDMSGKESGITLSNWDLGFFKAGNSTMSHLDTETPVIKMLAGSSARKPLGFLDQVGYYHFLQRFALRTHNDYNQTEAMKYSLEHQNPLVAGKVTGGDYYSEPEYSLLSISDPNVLLWALKPAEDGIKRGLVARVWNMAGESSNFDFGNNIQELEELSHIETYKGLPDKSINRYQMKTYLIQENKINASHKIK